MRPLGLAAGLLSGRVTARITPGRSAEAEHRDILQAVLLGHEKTPTRQQAAERLADFRRRTAGRGAPAAADLLKQSRAERMETLTGTGEEA